MCMVPSACQYGLYFSSLSGSVCPGACCLLQSRPDEISIIHASFFRGTAVLLSVCAARSFRLVVYWCVSFFQISLVGSHGGGWMGGGGASLLWLEVSRWGFWLVLSGLVWIHPRRAQQRFSLLHGCPGCPGLRRIFWTCWCCFLMLAFRGCFDFGLGCRCVGWVFSLAAGSGFASTVG